MIVSYARSGSFRARRLQAAKTRVFVVEHKSLTEAEKTALEAFYDTNRSLAIDFAWAHAPGTVYSAFFADEAGLDFRHVHGTEYWDVTVELAQA